MTQPLAIVLYEKLLPGSQLVNRLQDLKYRVHSINDAATLTAFAENTSPMFVLADLEPIVADVLAAVVRLKNNAATRHIPVLVFLDEVTAEIERAALDAGAALVASDSAMLSHLPQLLQQALRLD